MPQLTASWLDRKQKWKYHYKVRSWISTQLERKSLDLGKYIFEQMQHICSFDM
jgi:hypothetical protein